MTVMDGFLYGQDRDVGKYIGDNIGGLFIGLVAECSVGLVGYSLWLNSLDDGSSKLQHL